MLLSVTVMPSSYMWDITERKCFAGMVRGGMMLEGMAREWVQGQEGLG